MYRSSWMADYQMNWKTIDAYPAWITIRIGFGIWNDHEKLIWQSWKPMENIEQSFQHLIQFDCYNYFFSLSSDCPNIDDHSWTESISNHEWWKSINHK